jgi:hypothetical protein
LGPTDPASAAAVAPGDVAAPGQAGTPGDAAAAVPPHVCCPEPFGDGNALRSAGASEPKGSPAAVDPPPLTPGDAAAGGGEAGVEDNAAGRGAGVGVSENRSGSAARADGAPAATPLGADWGVAGPTASNDAHAADPVDVAGAGSGGGGASNEAQAGAAGAGVGVAAAGTGPAAAASNVAHPPSAGGSTANAGAGGGGESNAAQPPPATAGAAAGSSPHPPISAPASDGARDTAGALRWPGTSPADVDAAGGGCEREVWREGGWWDTAETPARPRPTPLPHAFLTSRPRPMSGSA